MKKAVLLSLLLFSVATLCVAPAFAETAHDVATADAVADNENPFLTDFGEWLTGTVCVVIGFVIRAIEKRRMKRRRF
ncbi:MAG: hypothetical protein GWN62_17670 [Aliifodinibius sp.]|nr:hypothetical protein [Fodinibius sp.]